MSSIHHDPGLDGHARSPVLGCLEPVWKTPPPFQYAGWRWLQCTKTPNEYKVLIPPKPANDYAHLLETEQIELAEKDIDWEYIVYLRRLKKRMINRASKLEKDCPHHAQNGGLHEIHAPAWFRLKQIEKWARSTKTGERKPTPEKHCDQYPVTHEIVPPLQHHAPHPRAQTTILDQPDLLLPNSHGHGSLVPPISNPPETVSLVQDVRPSPPNGGGSLFLSSNPSSNGDSVYPKTHQIPRSELPANLETHPLNRTTRAIFLDKQVQTDNKDPSTTIAKSSEPSICTRSVHRRVWSSGKPSIQAPGRSTNKLSSNAVIDEDSLQLPRIHTDSKLLGTLLHEVISSPRGNFPIPPSSPSSSDSEVVRRPLSDPPLRKSRWKHHTNHSHQSPTKYGPSDSPQAESQAEGDNKDVPKRLSSNSRPSDASQPSEGRGMETDRSSIRKIENPFILGNTHRLLTSPREKGNLTTKSPHPPPVENSSKVSLQEDVRDSPSRRHSFVLDLEDSSHHGAPPNKPALFKDTPLFESHVSQPNPKHRVPPSAPRRGIQSTSVYPGPQNSPSRTSERSPSLDQHRRTEVRSVTSTGVPIGRSDAASYSVNADRAPSLSRGQIGSISSFKLQSLDAIKIPTEPKRSSKSSMPPTPTKSDARHNHASNSAMDSDSTWKFARSQIPSFQSFTLDPLKNILHASSRSDAPQDSNVIPTMEAREPSEPPLPSSPGTLNHGRRSASLSTTAPAIILTRSPIFPPSPVVAPPPDNPPHRVPTLLRSPTPQYHPLSPMTIPETTKRPSRPSRKTTLLGILRKTFGRLKRRRSVRWVAGIKDGIIGSDLSSRPHSLSGISSSEPDFNSTSVRRTRLTRIAMEEGGVTFSLVFPPNFKVTRTSRVDSSLPQ